jgi:hypothetical protein
VFAQSDQAFLAGLDQRAQTLDCRDEPCERLQRRAHELRGMVQRLATSKDAQVRERVDRIDAMLGAIEVLTVDEIGVLERVELQALTLRLSKEVRALPQRSLASLRAVDAVLGLRAAAALV